MVALEEVNCLIPNERDGQTFVHLNKGDCAFRQIAGPRDIAFHPRSYQYSFDHIFLRWLSPQMSCVSFIFLQHLPQIPAATDQRRCSEGIERLRKHGVRSFLTRRRRRAQLARESKHERHAQLRWRQRE